MIWPFLIGILSLLFPGGFVAMGVFIGIRIERKKVTAYLRSLEDAPEPSHLATRIDARAHRGWPTEHLPDGAPEE